ncbi:MAG: leucine-rich repeat protein [Bacteroidales bacterium]
MIFKKLFLLCVITGMGISLKAQSYVLQDTDLTVSTDGIITDCRYDFTNKNITIPNSVGGTDITGIADVSPFGTIKIFYAQEITNVNLPSGIKTIGNNAFKGNDITSITLPDGLERIGESALSGNDFSFTHVDIPNSVTFIGEYAFSMNAIDSITLPQVTVPGFIEWIDDNGNQYAGGTKVEYNGDEYRAKIQYTLKDEDVEVNADGRITSCSYDFANTDIIIPETLDGITVKGIEDKSWTGVFDNKGITSLQLPNTILHIGDYAFSNNELSNIIIPDGVKYIGTQAFSSNNMDSINIPNSVTYIGQQAFWSIDSIILPTPTEAGFECWISSSGNIYQGGEKVKPSYDWFEAKIVYTLTSSDVRVHNGVIDSCLYDFSSQYIKIPDSLDNQRVIGIANGTELSFYNYYGVCSNKGIKEIQFPKYIESIGDYAFYENNLDSIIMLPHSVKYIGLNAFTLNNSFKGVVLPSPTNGTLICENWIDNNNNMYKIGDTITNFYERSYSAQFSYPPGTSIISLSETLSFEDVEVNSHESKVLTINNEGNSPFTISNIVLPDGYSADWTNGEILADNSQTVTITFSPTEEKNYSGMIKVISDATNGNDSIEVVGTYSPELISIISLSETLIFEDIEVNSHKSKALSINNEGNSPFTVSNIVLPDGYSADWTNGEILADNSQTVTITFSPTEEKKYSGMIKVISDATNGNDSIEVSGMSTITTSIYNTSASDNLHIHPNPASSYIILPSELGYTDIEIYTLNGTLLVKQSTFDNKIKIESLENGMYILKITNNKINIQTKFLKE